MPPESTRCPPNHITATVDRFMTSMTAGNIIAMRRPARTDVSYRSVFASPNRRRSRGSVTNARITRMPEICSRSTPLMVSIFFCMARKYGTIREMISPTTAASTGTITSSSHESCTSCWSARITPPIIMIGAMTMMVRLMRTSIWTCCTSFVARVMSAGAPKVPISCWEKDSTWTNWARRTSRPKPIATRAPRKTAAIVHATWTSVTMSIMPPTRQM